MENAIQIINKCSPGAFLAKADVQEAFRIIPLHPSQYWLTGFRWSGNYYFDRCLPMGCSSSCKIFEAFSSALKWITDSRSQDDNSIKVLDDFLFIARNKEKCRMLLTNFLAVCDYIGVPTCAEKTVTPTNELVFLGFKLNTLQMEASLPIEKLQRYSKNIIDALELDTLTLTRVKSIIGTLQHSSAVVRPGRPFLRRLYNLTTNLNNSRIIRLDNGAKEDLQMWLKFLSLYNGKTLIRDEPFTDSSTAHFYTDSSGLGFGGTFGSSWIQGKWPAEWHKMDITFFEFYPILVLVCIFAHKMSNARIMFHCDNQACVDIINSQTTKHNHVLPLLRRLVLTLLSHNIDFKARHIAGKLNKICDSISRFQDTPQFRRQYGLQPDCTRIPPHLEPSNYKLN